MVASITRIQLPLNFLMHQIFIWRMSSGMWCRVDLVWTDVCEEPAWAGGCRLRRYVPQKRWYTQDLHGATSQKTAFFIVTTMKTSNLTNLDLFLSFLHIWSVPHLTVFISWFCPASWCWDSNIYLIFSVFTSRPTSLLASHLTDVHQNINININNRKCGRVKMQEAVILLEELYGKDKVRETLYSCTVTFICSLVISFLFIYFSDWLGYNWCEQLKSPVFVS
jgi:hypothetical protein